MILKYKTCLSYLLFSSIIAASFGMEGGASKSPYEDGEFTSFTFGKGYKPLPKQSIYIKEVQEEHGETLEYFEVDTRNQHKNFEPKEIKEGFLLTFNIDTDFFSNISSLLQTSDIHNEKDELENEDSRVLIKEGSPSEEVLLSKSKGDRRQRVLSPKKAPWSFNGRLRIYFESNDDTQKSIVCLGSGVMIGPDLALTCAHNLYLSPTIQKKYPHLEPYAKMVTFLPGINGKQVYKESHIGRAVIAPEWVKSNDPGQDLALLHLEESIGVQIGYSAVDALPLQVDTEVSITGYPGELQDQMYTMSGPIKKIESHKIFYDIDTTKGNSGSSISKVKDALISEPICIGIHTTGSCMIDGISLNGGVHITNEKFTKIAGWIKDIKNKEEQADKDVDPSLLVNTNTNVQHYTNKRKISSLDSVKSIDTGNNVKVTETEKKNPNKKIKKDKI